MRSNSETALVTYRTKDDQPIRMAIECIGAHSGQLDLVLSAVVDGILAGRVYYSEFRKEPAVKMIEVNLFHRRRGIATALAIRLQEEYPDTEIEWGMRTVEGDAFIESLPSRFEPDPEFEDRSRRVEVLAAEIAELGKRYETLKERGETDKAVEFLIGSGWSEKQSERDDLVTELEFMKPGVTLIGSSSKGIIFAR